MGFRTLDFGQNLSSFPGAEIICHQVGRAYLTFDEIPLRGDVDFRRMGTVNAVGYDLVQDTHHVESFPRPQTRLGPCPPPRPRRLSPPGTARRTNPGHASRWLAHRGPMAPSFRKENSRRKLSRETK
ncbi:MAG: hypothetical protein HN904_17605, partial [Victivallales bacterium]|nr:hypothetical protein [Victivallales bacterium]